MKKFLLITTILASLFCFSSVSYCGTLEEEEEVKRTIEYEETNIKELIEQLPSEFKLYEYAIDYVSGSIYLADNKIEYYETQYGKQIECPNGNLYEIYCNNSSSVPIGSRYQNLKKREASFVSDDIRGNTWEVFENLFFLTSPETPVETTSGEQLVEISGELPEIVLQLQEMSVEKMKLVETMKTITIVAISCLTLLILSVILPKVLRIFLEQ